MYHIAIVEDEKEFRDQLQIYLKQYGKENQISFQISVRFFCFCRRPSGGQVRLAWRFSQRRDTVK